MVLPTRKREREREKERVVEQIKINSCYLLWVRACVCICVCANILTWIQAKQQCFPFGWVFVRILFLRSPPSFSQMCNVKITSEHCWEALRFNTAIMRLTYGFPPFPFLSLSDSCLWCLARKCPWTHKLFVSYGYTIGSRMHTYVICGYICVMIIMRVYNFIY